MQSLNGKFLMSYDRKTQELDVRAAYQAMEDLVTVCDITTSLVYLKKLLRSFRSQRSNWFEFYGQKMGYHVFPFIIDLVIRNGTTLPTLATKQLDDDLFEKLVDKYVHFPDPLSDPKTRQQLATLVPEWFVRTNYEQLEAQQPTDTIIPRILTLFRDIPNSDRTLHRDFIFARDLVLEKQFNVSLDELLYCAISVSHVANNNDFFGAQIDTDWEPMKKYVRSESM